MVTILKKGTSRSRIEKILEKLKRKKASEGIDAYKYCGIIELHEDPVEYQRKVRNEWD